MKQLIEHVTFQSRRYFVSTVRRPSLPLLVTDLSDSVSLWVEAPFETMAICVSPKGNILYTDYPYLNRYQHEADAVAGHKALIADLRADKTPPMWHDIPFDPAPPCDRPIDILLAFEPSEDRYLAIVDPHHNAPDWHKAVVESADPRGYCGTLHTILASNSYYSALQSAAIWADTYSKRISSDAEQEYLESVYSCRKERSANVS